MKRSRAVLLLMAGVLALSMLAACGTKPANPPATPAGEQSNAGESTQNPAPAAKPEAKTAKVLTYYSNSDLTAIEKEEQEISYTTEEEKYAKAMELLGKPSDPKHQPLWPNFAYHSITLQGDGSLTIDADSKNQYNLGSGGELMAIEALRMTMFQFPEVKTITILEDGQPIDSLMGHVDISQPIPR